MKLNAFKLGMPKWLPPKLLLIMKMVIIIMTATFLQVSASSFGQKVTLTESNISLDKLFKQIRKQTGYDFKQVKSHIQNGKRNLKIALGEQYERKTS